MKKKETLSQLIERIGIREFAQSFGIKYITAYSWKSGRSIPNADNRFALMKRFGLTNAQITGSNK